MYDLPFLSLKSIDYNSIMLYIITGLPFSGKSTFAKELVRRYCFERTSVDKMMNKRHLDAPNMTQKDWNLVYSEAYGELESLLKAGKTVVFDGGSLLKSERNTIKSIAEKYGVSWKLIYINTSIEEIAHRRKKNLVSQERDQLSDETMDKAFEMFEEPTPDENYITYDQSVNLDKWIDENIAVK